MLPPFSLSAELRARTRGAHGAAEAAFDLDARLADLDAHGELLVALRAFYVEAEHALEAVTGWDRLTPPVDIRSRRRTALLDADLGHLGIPAPAGPVSVVPILGSLAGALGCLYVLEGSTLGWQIVARRSRAALGGHLPVAFSSGPGRGEVSSRWRAFQASLDGFGAASDRLKVAEAVVAARETFAALAALLGSTPVPA